MRLKNLTLLALASVLLLNGCDCGSPPTTPGQPGTATKLAFTVQPTRAAAGSVLAPAVRVTVQDADGKPVTDSQATVTIALKANPTGATLSGAASAQATGGEASFADLTLDKAGEGYTLVAHAEGLEDATSQAFNVDAGAARQLAFTTEPGDTEAGANFGPRVSVSVSDAFGNSVKEGTAVTLTLGANPAGGTLSGTLTVNTVGGVATFAELSLDKVGEGYTLAASAPGLSPVTSGAFRVKPGKARTLEFLTQPSSVVAGVVLSPAVQVRLVDAHGNAASGATDSVTLALSSNSTGGTLSGTLTVAAVDGVATFPDLSVARAGTYTLAASSPTLDGATSDAFTVTAGPAVRLLFDAQPLSVEAGNAFTPPLQVDALDAQGNVVSGFSGPVTVALKDNPTGDTLKGTLTVSAVAGVARFDTLSLDRAGTGYSLSATSPSLTPAVSLPFDVFASTPARLAFSVQPSRTSLGAVLSPAVQVRIEDSVGNLVTSATSSITLALSGGTSGAVLGGTRSVSAINGVATFPDLTVNRQGTGYNLTASASGLASSGSALFDIDGIPTQLAFLTQPSSSVSGQALSPAVKVVIQDVNGDTVLSATQTITVALGNNPSGATLSGTRTVSAVNGVATFADLSVDKAGSGYTLQASATALASATSSAFDVTAGAPARLSFSTQPTQATAGVAISPAIAVSVVDAAGNVTTSTASITVALGNNPGGATLSGTATVSAVNGVATFSGLSLDKAGTGYTLVASATGLTGDTSSAFDIRAAAPSRLAFRAQPSNSTAGVAISPAVAARIEDAFGNLTSSTASITVALGSNASGATLSGTLTVAAVAGEATFSTLSLDKAGTGYTLTASSAGLGSATSSTFDISAGPAARLAFRVQPSNVAAGSPITPAVEVSVVDTFGNVVASSTATITVGLGSAPTGATLSGTLSQDAVLGVARFTTLSLPMAGTGYTLQASSPGLTPASSASFNVTPGAAQALAFTVQPSNVVAGASIAPAVKVSVLDAFGNTVTGSSAAIQLALASNPSGGTLSGALTASASSGVATFSNLSVNRAGAGYTLTATSSGLTASTSTAFDVAPGAAQALAFTVQPTHTTAGVSITPSVAVSIVDGLGNTVSSATGSITVALGNNPSGGTLSGTLTVSTVGGVATFPGLSLAKSGTGYTLTASAAGLTGSTSSAFNVAPAAATQLVFTVQPSNGLVDQALSPAVQVSELDAFGNVSSGSSASITVGLGNNPSGATLGGTLTVSVINGVASFSTLTVDKGGTGYTLVASAAGLTSATSTAFNVTAPPRLVYTAPASSGKIALVRNAASTNSTVVLDLVALVDLTGYSVGFNLPLDSTRVQANTTLMSPGSALPAGTSPTAAYSKLPSTGPLAGMLTTGQSQKAAGPGAVVNDSTVPAGSVFYTVRLDLKTGASPGVVFDGAALGSKFRALLRDRLGTDSVSSNEFAIGRLEVQ